MALHPSIVVPGGGMPVGVPPRGRFLDPYVKLDRYRADFAVLSGRVDDIAAAVQPLADRLETLESIVASIPGTVPPVPLASQAGKPADAYLTGAAIRDVRGMGHVPYLFSVRLDDTYDAEGAEYRASHYGSGACTAFKAGRWFGRSYDWTYSHGAVFQVFVSAAPGRRASVGTAFLGEDLPASAAGVFTELHRCLPGMTKDGRNDAGVAVSINVVPRKSSGDWPTAPSGARQTDCVGAVRHVLDRCSTAAEAAAWLADSVYIPSGYPPEYSVHYLVADASSAYLVEDAAYHEISSSPFITNFRRWGTGGSLSIARDDVASWDPYGAGLERAAVVQAGIPGVASAGVAAALLRSVRYTRTYPSAPDAVDWPSEMCSEEYGVSLSSQPSAFAQALAVADSAYRVRSRTAPSVVDVGGSPVPVATWQSVWQVVYDLDPSTPVESACVWIRAQEDYGDYAPVPVARVPAPEVDVDGLVSKEALLSVLNGLADPKAAVSDIKDKFVALVSALKGLCS